MEHRARVILRAACAWLFVAGLAVCVSQAQLPVGTISGTVKDATGAVVPSANVTAISADTGEARTTQSGPDGHFNLPGLPVGTYNVKAEAAGFQTQVQQGLSLSVAQEAVLTFTLPVGTVQQTVTVSAEAPLVDTTSGALGGLVNSNTVTDLPLNGRSFNSLVEQETGITVAHPVSTTSTTSIGLDFSSNGAPIRSNYMTLDGANYSSSQGITGVSTSGLMLGIDGVREFRIINNNFPAEYGMTMGSQMIIVTKNGTNQVHGTLFEFLRNDDMDANPYFANFSSQPKAAFRRNNFGGSLGGPIRKDKDFYFLTYEGLRETEAIPELPAVPSADALLGTIYTSTAALNPSTPCSQLPLTKVNVSPAMMPYLNLFPAGNLPIATDPCGAKGATDYAFNYEQPESEDFGQARYDKNISDTDQFFARYTIDDTRLTESQGLPGFTETLDSRGQFITLAENHIFSPTVLNAFRLSYSQPDQNFLYPPAPGTSGLAFASGAVGALIPGLQMGGVTATGGFSLPSGNPLQYKTQEETLSNDLSWSHGKHAFKFGTLMNNIRDLLWTNLDGWGSWSFSNVQNFLTDVPLQLAIIAPGSKTDRTYAFKTLGFYAQDEWRALPHLTLDIGLRYEFNTTVNEVTGADSSYSNILTQVSGTVGLPLYKNPSLHNFGPRFGFAWDPFGDGKTALRGGFGEFFDIANMVAAADIETTGTLPYSTTLMLTNSQVPLCFPACTNIPSIAQVNAGTFPSAVPSPRTIEYEQAQPHLLSWNLTAERQLPGSIALSVGYAGSRGINIIQTVDGNPIIPISNGIYPLVLPSMATCVSSPGTAGCRENPLIGTCECKTTGGDSWYNALQARLQKQMTHNLQFQVSYTFSKALDDTQGQHGGEAGGSGIFGTDPWDLAEDKGPTDFNTPHWLAVNAIYTLPGLAGGKGFMGGLTSGWRTSGIFTFTSGLPFTVTESNCRSNSMVDGVCADRVDVVPGCQQIIFNGNPTYYFNPNCFALQPGGILGDEGRNDLMGPSHIDLDFSLVKDTPLPRLGEGRQLEFRAEVFNLFNRPDFNIPTGGRTVFNATATTISTPPPGAGSITSTIGSPREIQLALKFIF